MPRRGRCLRKPLALDPQYAEAYARLGWTYYLEWILALECRTLRPWTERISLAQQALASRRFPAGSPLALER